MKSQQQRMNEIRDNHLGMMGSIDLTDSDVIMLVMSNLSDIQHITSDERVIERANSLKIFLSDVHSEFRLREKSQTSHTNL